MDRQNQGIARMKSASLPASVPSKPRRSVALSVLAQKRSRPHFLRKFYHLAMGLGCFALYALVLTRGQALSILGTLGGALVVLDVLRLRFPEVNRFGLRVFGGLMRREELRSLTGNSFYILGLFLIVLVFPKPIVLLSVLFLAVGDPIAAVIGTLYGRTPLLGKKSAEGAAANFTASSVVAFAFAMAYLGLSPDRAATLALVGGAVSVVAELCPLPVDDNFTIPVLSAIGLSAANIALALF